MAKYIIFNDNNGLEIPLIFPNLIYHRQIDVLGACPISAGFVDWVLDTDGKMKVSISGESVSLKLKPRPEDVDLIISALKGRL